MNGSRRIRLCFLFFFVAIVLISVVILPAVGEENDGITEKEENPSFVSTVYRVLGEKFPPSSWELIQGAIRKIQMKLYPPNLDFRSNSDNSKSEEEGKEDNKGEKVKEAATRSLEVSKEAIEESAKLAGGVVSEVVHNAAEKVVTKQTSHDEM